MEAVGIDPSLKHCGFANVVSPFAPFTATFPTESLDNSLKDLQRRIRYITGRVLHASGPSVLTVIESPIIPRHGSGEVLERAWLFGFLVDQMLLRGPVVAVHPMTRAKYATGKGRASKPEVLAAMRAKFPDQVIADDNEADALALCAMGSRFLGYPIDGEPSKAQLEAMRAVRWQPTPKEKN